MSIRFASLALAAALCTAPAFAQSPATPGHRDAAVESRVTQLHGALKITAAQEPQFDAFAAVMRQNATDMDGLAAKRMASAKSGTAVEQMQTYADMAQAHAQQMQKLLASFFTLYDALTPEQKKLADASFRHYADRAAKS